MKSQPVKGNNGTKTEPPKVEKMSDDEDDRPKITFVSKKDRLKRDRKVDVKSEKVEKGIFILFFNFSNF